MARDDLSVLPLLLTVAEERSFTRAARRLGVSPSAVSHAVRGLEERLGVRLLSRTTRSVAPTEAGEQLLARLRPAMSEVRTALDQISGLRNKPAGRIRLLAPRLAVSSVFAPKLGQFARDYPLVLLDITTDDSRMDIVAGGFDAKPLRRERLIPVPAPMAAKAALYLAMKGAGMSNAALARRLGRDEKEVRRMLDPRHPTKLPRIKEALDLLGKRLVVSVEDAA